MAETPFSPRLTRLTQTLRRLPGVGPKSAGRMAYQLMAKDRAAAGAMADALTEALAHVGQCPRCRMFCDDGHCLLCSDARTDTGQLCVVETPADLMAVESGTSYRGRYFVLMGRLSPLDGVGPTELGLDALDTELASGRVRELIIATNPTVEGQTTAHYIAALARAHGIPTTRPAQGVPMGGELEYVDAGTLAHALAGRQVFS